MVVVVAGAPKKEAGPRPPESSAEAISIAGEVIGAVFVGEKASALPAPSSAATAAARASPASSSGGEVARRVIERRIAAETTDAPPPPPAVAAEAAELERPPPIRFKRSLCPLSSAVATAATASGDRIRDTPVAPLPLVFVKRAVRLDNVCDPNWLLRPSSPSAASVALCCWRRRAAKEEDEVRTTGASSASPSASTAAAECELVTASLFALLAPAERGREGDDERTPEKGTAPASERRTAQNSAAAPAAATALVLLPAARSSQVASSKGAADTVGVTGAGDAKDGLALLTRTRFAGIFFFIFLRSSNQCPYVRRCVCVLVCGIAPPKQ